MLTLIRAACTKITHKAPLSVGPHIGFIKIILYVVGFVIAFFLEFPSSNEIRLKRGGVGFESQKVKSIFCRPSNISHSAIGSR